MYCCWCKVTWEHRLRCWLALDKGGVEKSAEHAVCTPSTGHWDYPGQAFRDKTGCVLAARHRERKALLQLLPSFLRCSLNSVSQKNGSQKLLFILSKHISYQKPTLIHTPNKYLTTLRVTCVSTQKPICLSLT